MRTAHLRKYDPTSHNGRGAFHTIDERPVLAGRRAADVVVMASNYNLLPGQGVQVVIVQDGVEVDWAMVSAIQPQASREATQWIAADTLAERTADAAA